jgi:hypothetical protein
MDFTPSLNRRKQNENQNCDFPVQKWFRLWTCAENQLQEEFAHWNWGGINSKPTAKPTALPRISRIFTDGTDEFREKDNIPQRI